MLTFPRETIEYLPIADFEVIDDETGEPVENATYEICVVVDGQRPSVFSAPPFLISGMTPETVYRVFLHVDSGGTEQIVIDTDNDGRPLLFKVT